MVCLKIARYGSVRHKMVILYRARGSQLEKRNVRVYDGSSD